MRAPSFLSTPGRRLSSLGVVLAAAFVVVAALAGGVSRGAIEAAVAGSGWLGPLLFVLLYAALTVLLFPGSVVTAAGGALFGIVFGTLLSVIGATLGASAAFLIARRLGRRDVELITGERVRAMDAWLERRGFFAILGLRLVPLVPFNALNYAAGVTALRPASYVLGTAVGIVPGAFAWAALGGSIGDPLSPRFLGAVALVVFLTVLGALVDRLARPGRGASTNRAVEARQPLRRNPEEKEPADHHPRGDRPPETE